jgi:hypothetical protein
MADPTKIIKGGLSAVRNASRAADQAMEAKRLARDEALAKLDVGQKLSKAENIAAGLYHPIGEGKKLNIPFSRMTSTVVDNPNVIMHQGKIITPEQAVKERMGFFPLIGDRAETGKILTHVNERKAKYQTPLTGGGKYMQANYDPIMEKSAGWESGKGKVGTLRNRISDIAQSGYQPVGVFSPGSHVQVDFNTMMPHALLGQFEPSDTTKKLIKQFDKEVKAAYPDWVGITNPLAEAQLMGKGNGVLRTQFTKTMGKDDYQSGGFPDVPSVRKAISDPDLYETELGTLGQNMALFDPTGALVEAPKNPSAYPLSMSAQNLGRLDQTENFADFFTTANERRRLLNSDPTKDYRSFELAQPIQYADEEWLNKLMESRRLRDKAIKKGGYAEGGEVDSDQELKAMIADHLEGQRDDPELRSMIEGYMAGGGVHMVDGGKIAKGVMGAIQKASKFAESSMAAAERDANKAKFLESSIEKRRMYHGTNSDVGNFAPGRVGTFVTPDAEFANAFARANGANVMPVRVQVKNPFDYEKKEHVENLRTLAKKRFPGNNRVLDELDYLSTGGSNWSSVEHPDIQRLIKEAGYDSFYASEADVKNLGIYDPKRIKSDIGNRGTYDINYSDINKAEGGAMFKTLQWREPQKFDNGGIASPEESSTPPPDGDQTYAGLMAEYLAQAAKDQGRQELSSLKKPRAVTDLINRGVLANNPLSAIIDMVNMGLLPLDVLGSQLTGRDIRVSSEKPFLGSEHLKDLMNKYNVTSGEERPMMETGLSFASPVGMIKGAQKTADLAKKAPEMVRKAESGLNEMRPAVQRPFTPATFPVEATAPDLGQGTSYGFRQGLNDRLLANPKLGTGKTKAREGQGTYVNTKGELELNPLQAVDVPRAGNIGEGPKANRALRQQVAQMGVDLNQEAMAGHRFLPMMTNNIKDASAMLIKTKEGLSKDQIADLARVLGSDMVVSHNPKLGGVVVFPFGPVTKGQIPEEFLTAQSAANKVLGKDAKIQYGKSDFAKDRLFMDKSEYPGAGAVPMSAEQQALRGSLQGIEKFMFPESVSGIPGSVKASPMGGLQSWSRGVNYPTSVVGIGNREKVEYQPVNFLTSAEGKRYPSYREADEERAKMLDSWHRTLPAKAR